VQISQIYFNKHWILPLKMRDLPQKGVFYLTYCRVITFLNTFAITRKVRGLLIGLKEKSIY
jgi:hypothetical protein